MFKVFLDGVYHSTHKTFTDACRHARMEAALNQNAYFTVFEAGEKTSEMELADADEVMLGVPDYIITPHYSTETTTRKSSLGLRMRLPAYSAAAQ